MSTINSQAPSYPVKVYYSDRFRKVTERDFVYKWTTFCFCITDLIFLRPIELDDWADPYVELKKLDFIEFFECTIVMDEMDHHVHLAIARFL